MAKYNFSKVKVLDIEGNPVKEEPKKKLHQLLGNTIYLYTKDLALIEVGKKIYHGEEVEIEKAEMEEIKRMIMDERYGFHAFTRKTLLDYIEETLKSK